MERSPIVKKPAAIEWRFYLRLRGVAYHLAKNRYYAQWQSRQCLEGIQAALPPDAGLRISSVWDRRVARSIAGISLSDSSLLITCSSTNHSIRSGVQA